VSTSAVKKTKLKQYDAICVRDTDAVGVYYIIVNKDFRFPVREDVLLHDFTFMSKDQRIISSFHNKSDTFHCRVKRNKWDRPIDYIVDSSTRAVTLRFVTGDTLVVPATAAAIMLRNTGLFEQSYVADQIKYAHNYLGYISDRCSSYGVSYSNLNDFTETGIIEEFEKMHNLIREKTVTYNCTLINFNIARRYINPNDIKNSHTILVYEASGFLIDKSNKRVALKYGIGVDLQEYTILFYFGSNLNSAFLSNISFDDAEVSTLTMKKWSFINETVTAYIEHAYKYSPLSNII
jgi:hypothetical protein